MEHRAYWKNEINKPDFPSLKKDLHVDYLVIGGGITGLTAAYLLSKGGENVALMESKTVGSGVTGNSSGHLSTAIDGKYSKIADRFNDELAVDVARSTQEAIELVEVIARSNHIDCDFERIPGWLFSESKKHDALLEEEWAQATHLKLGVEMKESAPLPWPNHRAIMFPGQARFHPLKYSFGLARAIQNCGGRIFENSRTDDIEETENGVVTKINGFTVNTKKTILATHSPISLNPIQLSIYPYRSYCLGLRITDDIPDALFWDMEQPYHYIRKAWINEEEIVIVGGGDHKSGQVNDENQQYEQLKQYSQERFDIIDIPYRWSAQVFEPADGLPYIGLAPFKNHTYIATGFSGDGLLFGSLAGEILSDLVREKGNPYAETYSPSRLNISSAKDLLVENINVAYRFIKDRLVNHIDDLNKINLGDGGILDHEGELYAVYKDQTGDISSFSPVCSHLKCIVHWNKAEGTWDCPCHGGRYEANGKVLEGPPHKDLEQKDLPLEKIMNSKSLKK